MSWFSWFWSLFGGPPAPEPEQITKVQALTVKACGFLPAASTVAAMIGAATGQGVALTTAFTFATAICKAVTTNKRAVGLFSVGGDPNNLSNKPTVNIEGTEIIVEGEFIK